MKGIRQVEYSLPSINQKSGNSNSDEYFVEFKEVRQKIINKFNSFWQYYRVDCLIFADNNLYKYLISSLLVRYVAAIQILIFGQISIDMIY